MTVLMDIANRRVLITGASRGLGRTLAFAFAAAGAREVFAGARKPEDIEKLKRDAATIGAPVTPIKLDVTNEDDISAAGTLGFIDVLVNNAGVAGYGDPVLMNFENALDEMNVNYFGALRMARALTPAMIERGEGMIVSVATAFAKVNLPLVGYLLIGSIPGGLIGSYLSTRVPVLWLRRILCVILLATGARMLWA